MRLAVFLIGVVLFVSVPVRAGEVPDELAGFRLGGHFKDVKERVRAETMLPLRFSPFIHEVETVDIPGYKFGLLWVGNCSLPGRIVRIKMKYANPTKAFYKELLERLEDRFGKPDEWRGDPFHIFEAWKWGFKDKNGNDISMILEHDAGEGPETMGNSIKLTMWNLVENEKRCYRRKNPDSVAGKASTPSVDVDRLIPQ